MNVHTNNYSPWRLAARTAWSANADRARKVSGRVVLYTLIVDRGRGGLAAGRVDDYEFA